MEFAHMNGCSKDRERQIKMGWGNTVEFYILVRQRPGHLREKSPDRRRRVLKGNETEPRPCESGPRGILVQFEQQGRR